MAQYGVAIGFLSTSRMWTSLVRIQSTLTRSYSSSPCSRSSFDEDFEKQYADPDILCENDAATDGPIDWSFGQFEVEDFLRRRERHHSLPIVHHHGFVCEIPPKHRFVMGKFDGLFNYLMMDGVVTNGQV